MRDLIVGIIEASPTPLIRTEIAVLANRSNISTTQALTELVRSKRIRIVGFKVSGGGRFHIYAPISGGKDDTATHLEPWQRAARARFEQYGKL